MLLEGASVLEYIEHLTTYFVCAFEGTSLNHHGDEVALMYSAW